MDNGTVSAPIEPTSGTTPLKTSPEDKPKYSLLRINTIGPIILLIFIWIIKIFAYAPYFTPTLKL